MSLAVSPRTARPRVAQASSLFAIGSRVRSSVCRVRCVPRLTVRAVATPRDAKKKSGSSPDVSGGVWSKHPPPAGALESPSLRCGFRDAAIPYFGDAVDRKVLVNDAARSEIQKANATPFISLPEETNPALIEVRKAMEKGWQIHEALGSGSAVQWPELFGAGAELVKQTVGALWPIDSVEILTGTGWLEPMTNTKPSTSTDYEKQSAVSNDIDWVMRRPEGHVVSSKTHFANRLHRDPDSWTNPATPQRPKDGWTELAMPERKKYAYRFINVWVARSAIDPTGQVWQSPLVVCLPRDAGEREWAFEKRKLAMETSTAKEEYNVKGVNFVDPKTWIPGVNRLFRPLWNPGAGAAGAGGPESDPENEVTAEEMAKFEFPELTPSETHTFVTAPALVFDSFDLWHGAGVWADCEETKKQLRKIDTKGRQPFHRARCSIEMRFRIKIDVEAAKAARTDESLTHKKTEEQEKSQVSPWGPFSSAVASGKFRHDGYVFPNHHIPPTDCPCETDTFFFISRLRDSEARYDLGEGVVLD